MDPATDMHEEEAYPPTQQEHHQQAPASGGPMAFVKSIDGFTRIVQWFFSLLAFACMASVDGYDDIDQFAFVVATGVMIWLYTMFIIIVSLAGQAEKFSWFSIFQLGGDLLFLLFTLIAGAVGASKCNSDYAMGQSLCELADSDDERNIKASIAFTFILFFTFCWSSFFSFRKYRG